MKKELFKKITDIRTLWKAWEKVKEKNTASGIDNISIFRKSNILSKDKKTFKGGYIIPGL